MSVVGEITFLVAKIGFYAQPVVEQGQDIDIPVQADITIITGDTRILIEGTEYGLLYNRYALEDARGLAPPGWHVAGLHPPDPDIDPPGTQEGENSYMRQWDYWELYFGLFDNTQPIPSSYPDGGALKSHRTEPDAHPRWDYPNVGRDTNPSTNSLGFNALPGGIRMPDGGFHYMGEAAAYWSLVTEHGGEDSPFHVAFTLWNFISIVFHPWKDTDFGQDGAWNAGLAIRLKRNTPIGWMPGEKVIDASGNVYDTVRITNDKGYSPYDEVWTTSDLRTTRFFNGDSIPHLQDDIDWVGAATPGYCYYDHPELSALIYAYQKYGKLNLTNQYVERLLLASRGLLANEETGELLLERFLI